MMKMKWLNMTAAAAMAGASLLGTSTSVMAASDAARLEVTIAGSIQVTACNSPVLIGTINDNQTYMVDATDVALSVCFDIDGANSNWDLTVAFNDLTPNGFAAANLDLQPPATADICFNDAQATVATCDVSGESGLTVNKTDHGGDGRAQVGYQIVVPLNQDSGDYFNNTAVVLTANVILGT